MELNLRTVLVVIGSIVMLAILVDGFRRMRRARQEALKIDVQGDFKFPEESFSSELPNGGARIIGDSAQFDYDSFNDFVEESSKSLNGSESNLEDRQTLDCESFNGEIEDTNSAANSEDTDVLSALTALDDDDQETDNNIEIDTPSFGNSVEMNTNQTDELSAVDATNESGLSIEEHSLNSGAKSGSKTGKKKEQQKEQQEEQQTGDKSEVVESNNLNSVAKKVTKQKLKPLNLDEQVPLLIDVEELGEEVESAHHVDSFLETELEADTKKEELNISANQNSTSESGTPAQSELDRSSAESLVLNEEFLEKDIAEHIELTQKDIKGIEESVSVIASLLSPEQLEKSQSANSADTSSDSMIADHKAIQAELFDHDRQEAKDLTTQAAYAPVKKPGVNAETLASRSTPDLVLITHVTPHDEGGFLGEDVLFLVNSCDLRHGEKGIFHRYEQENGEGKVQFSMANSINPGTFDPSTLLYERINGLSLFMSLPGPEKAMDAFEAMTEMASVIARNLGGYVHDETHSIMALQTIEHNRQLVRDFVRKQKLLGKKK